MVNIVKECEFGSKVQKVFMKGFE